jgi:hypothetical protein
MLYDKRWEKPKEPSLEGFVAWLETRPADGKYNWSDPDRCACAQYAMAIGQFAGWRHNRGWNRYEWVKLNTVAKGARYHLFDQHTFGKCLKRARKELKKEKAYAI